ncbi:hypothetical protein FRB95_008756 [Tulasnella sp. JGI-2019a]|nr:hypothetical protein FRB95_008756 [Tulasnella sp. JGI-2019a]
MPIADSLATAGTHVVAGTKLSLGVLSSFSGFIPIPFVKLAVDAAIQVITIAQTVKGNRKALEILQNRVHAIMLVVIMPWTERTEDDVPMELRRNLERLSANLLKIVEEMQNLQRATGTRRFSAFFKSVLMSDNYAKIITDCTNSLDWAMQVFQVEQHIDTAVRTSQVSDAIQVVHEDVQGMKTTMEKIADEIQSPRPSPPLYLSVVPPPKPAIFHGRNDVVRDIVQRILFNPPTRFALLGPGGLGKTSVALAVAENEEVVHHFGSRRYFVRCDEATSLAVFIELVARAIATDKPSNNRLQDIMASLRRDTRPYFLILDNFETPWDIPGCQSDLLDALCTISTVPHLVLLVTMRGVLPDPTRIQWTKPPLAPLEVLSQEAARNLYLEIDPEAKDDPSLDSLLAELSYMPLAVTLMARAGSEGEMPSELLVRWKAEGTDVIHQPGADRRTSVPLSIELSLHSNVMKNDPDATRLLSVLSFLPGGAKTAIIPNLVPSLSHPSKARASLLKAALIYLRSDDNSLHVLSPIRSYINHQYPITPEQRGSVSDFYIDYIQQHWSYPGDPSFLKHCEALIVEETNLETVLLSAISDTEHPSPATMEAVLAYATHQYRTHPRTEITTAAIAVARRTSMDAFLPRFLVRLGDIDRLQGRYTQALVSLVEARQGFQRLGDDALAAECLRSIGQTNRVQGRFDEAVKNLRQAQSDFLELGDRYAAATCLRILGDAERMQGRFEEARIALVHARDDFEALGNSNAVALSLTGIADVDRLQGRFTDARLSLQAALEQVRKTGSPSAPAFCLRSLGEMDVEEGKFDDARVALTEALEMFKRIGDPRGGARCLRNLGLADLKQGNLSRGRSELESARETFQQLGLEQWATWCTSQLDTTCP